MHDACYCSVVREQTHLPLDGHGGDILKHDVLHLSVRKRIYQITYSDTKQTGRRSLHIDVFYITCGFLVVEPVTW